jgi:hypothetical protein
MDNQVAINEGQTTRWRNPEVGEQIEIKSHQISDRLVEAYANASAALQDYLRFKTSHGDIFGRENPNIAPIMRAPVYPDSHIMTFSILASMVLIEGLANAYFFSRGSDLGLLGGWIQAITVAATNIAVGFFLIGFLGIRMIQNTKLVYFPVIGWTLIATGIVAVVVINLSAAHYRDRMEIEAMQLDAGIDALIESYDDPVADTGAIGTTDSFDETSSTVEPGYIENNGQNDTQEPLAHNGFVQFVSNGPFVTLEALLLFVLGMTFAVIAAFKGATFDDRFIGFGATHRRMKKSLAQLTATLKQLPKEAIDDDKADSPTKRVNLRERAVELKHKMEDLIASEADDALKDYKQACAERGRDSRDDFEDDKR